MERTRLYGTAPWHYDSSLPPPRRQAPLSGNRKWGWGSPGVPLAPSTGRGWAPHSVGVGRTVTRCGRPAGISPADSPRPGCAAAQAGVTRGGV